MRERLSEIPLTPPMDPTRQQLCECGYPNWEHYGKTGRNLRPGIDCLRFKAMAGQMAEPKKEIVRVLGEEIPPDCATIADEDAEMIAYFSWCETQVRIKRIPELVLAHHIPNGGHRSWKTAKMLKATGVKPGVPDIEIPVPRRGFTGAHIEMKRTKGGKLEDHQRDFLMALQDQGRFTFEAKGWQVARMATEWYFGLGPWFAGDEPRGPWEKKPKKT